MKVTFHFLLLFHTLLGLTSVASKRRGSSSSSSVPVSSLPKSTSGVSAEIALEDPKGCRIFIKDYFRAITITGYYGDSVVLPCDCTDPQARPRLVQWERRESSGNLVVFNTSRRASGSYTHEDYAGRVGLVENSPPGNLSLIITNLTEKDAGSYLCRVDEDSDEVDLLIEGCDLAHAGERLEVKALAGASVLLPCWCSEMRATPKTLTWRDPDGRIIRTYSELSGRYAARLVTFQEEAIWNASLLLSDVSVEDEGEYTCEINSNTVTVSLTITDCTLIDPDMVVELEVSPGSSVLLPCACANVETRPRNVRWVLPNGRELLWHYRSRAKFFHQGAIPGNLSLQLDNLMPDDQGVYRCEVTGGKSRVFVLKVTGPSVSKLQGDETDVAILENPCRLQHLLLFILAAVIVLLITHITVGAMIIRWRYENAARTPCVHYST